jgi:hypothetical protein
VAKALIAGVILVAAAAFVLALAGGEESSDEPRAERAARQAAPPPRPGLARHLTALQRIAERSGGHRAAGSPGDAASVRYVAARLRAAGWRVRLQPLSFPRFRERTRPRLEVAGAGRLRAGRDFRTIGYSGSGRLAAARLRVLPGQGCSRAELAALVPGEVALVRRGRCLFRVKARAAASAGAAALLVYDGAEEGEPPSATLGRLGARIPVLILSGRAGRLLADGGGARVRLSVRALSERRRTHNVLAESSGGSGGRVVMAGGHLDSVSAGPGINDNGSGVAALLHLAERLRGRSPGARVRLAFWGAEELGLIGSRRYVRSLPRAERSRITAYLNLDMVGSPNARTTVYDSAEAPRAARAGARRLERLLRRLLGGNAPAARTGGASDHAPFAAAGIPVGGIYTGGPERGRGGRPRDACYHRACDTARNVDRRVLRRVARAAAAAVSELARSQAK